MSAELSVGFWGAGKMATALAQGFIHGKVTDATRIIASDPVEPARAAFAREVKAKVTASNLEVAQSASVLVLAVKPDQVGGVLKEVRGSLTADALVLSIAAGVTLATLQSGLGTGVRVIRVMPNTPALVGASATAYAPGANATADDGRLAHRLFSLVGAAFELKESLLDAVTGLSGSGPAYVMLMIEALSDGGVAAGLPRDVATKLAAQTVFGSAKLLLETGKHPGTLKDMVTSPGGTTIEGLHELEKGGVRAALITAVRAAAEKSRRLGNG